MGAGDRPRFELTGLATSLDYFGQNVELAIAASTGTPPAGVGITQPVCQDVAMAERVKALVDQLGMQPFGASR